MKLIQEAKKLTLLTAKRILRIPLTFLFDSFFRKQIDAQIISWLLFKPLYFGDPYRVSISPLAVVNNALFNTVSGTISIEDYAFFGHNVCLLTGTHSPCSFGKDRQDNIPCSGNDIVVKTGSWVASNATIIGPCIIGEHAVVAAGAVVTKDVPPFCIVAGVPAKPIGTTSDISSKLRFKNMATEM